MFFKIKGIYCNFINNNVKDWSRKLKELTIINIIVNWRRNILRFRSLLFSLLNRLSRVIKSDFVNVVIKFRSVCSSATTYAVFIGNPFCLYRANKNGSIQQAFSVSRKLTLLWYYCALWKTTHNGQWDYPSYDGRSIFMKRMVYLFVYLFMINSNS